MPEKHTQETEQSDRSSIPRRRVLSASAAGLGTIGVTGLSGTVSARGSSSDEPLVEKEDFDADITSYTQDTVNYTETYVGPDRVSDGPSFEKEAIASLSERVYLATIPNNIPEIGGTDIELTFDATFGFTEVSVSIGICFGGFCLTLIGAGISYSDAEICFDVRGKLKTIPLQVEGCFTFAPSLNPIGLTVGGSVGVCLDLPKIEEVYEKDGWEWTRKFLCIEEGVSVTL
jgi:hypothetical protein